LTLKCGCVMAMVDLKRGKRMPKQNKLAPDFVSRFDTVVVASSKDREVSELLSHIDSVREHYREHLSETLLDLEMIEVDLPWNFTRTEVISNDKVFAAMEKILPLMDKIFLLEEDVKKQLSLGATDVVIDDNSIVFLKEELKKVNDYCSKKQEEIISLVREVEKEAKEITETISAAMLTYDVRFEEIQILSKKAREFRK